MISKNPIFERIKLWNNIQEGKHVAIEKYNLLQTVVVNMTGSDFAVDHFNKHLRKFVGVEKRNLLVVTTIGKNYVRNAVVDKRNYRVDWL